MDHRIVEVTVFSEDGTFTLPDGAILLKANVTPTTFQVNEDDPNTPINPQGYYIALQYLA